MMTKEFLPIRQFTQRDIDEQKVEGGGSTSQPSWVLAGDELRFRAEYLQSSFDDAIHATSHNPALPYAFRIRLDERHTAKSKRRAVLDMFCINPNEPSNLVGMVGSTNVIMRVSDSESAAEIGARLQDFERYEEAISCVLDISRFLPSVAESEDDCYKVCLFGEFPEKPGGSELFEEELSSLGIECREVRYTRDSKHYKVWASKAQIQAILDSSVAEMVFSIKPVPKLNVVLDGLNLPSLPSAKEPDSDSEYPVLGILDTGVAPIEHLAPWMHDERFSPYPECDMNVSHGTFVTGVALYGDELERKKWVGGKTPKAFDAVIVPDLARMSCDERRKGRRNGFRRSFRCEQYSLGQPLRGDAGAAGNACPRGHN